MTLRNRLDALTVQQAELLDKVLEDMENEELNAQAWTGVLQPSVLQKSDGADPGNQDLPMVRE